MIFVIYSSFIKYILLTLNNNTELVLICRNRYETVLEVHRSSVGRNLNRFVKKGTQNYMNSGRSARSASGKTLSNFE